MEVRIEHNKLYFTVNLYQPIDISLPINENSVSAWNAPKMQIKPAKDGNWVGDVLQGASVNFNNIFFNPHAHCTHTECVGHISPNKEVLNDKLKQYFFMSKLISVCPKKKNHDLVITKNMIKKLVDSHDNVDALIIRTLPNAKTKMSVNYSNTNPPYLLKEALDYLVEINIKHLLVDLPSIDKEQDDGALVGHKSFWQFNKETRLNCTITEFIYVDNNVKDDIYLLNLQFVPFSNDASPSRPVLFKLN